jgi:glycosyltransferase involved in cell wall biosynthesis
MSTSDGSRVALVTSAASPTLGGVPTMVDALARALRQRGRDVDIVTASPGHASPGTVRVGSWGPELIALPNPGFRHALRRYDIVHVFNLHTPFAWAALRTGRPTVLTPNWHGGSERAWRNMAWVPSRALLRGLVRGSAVVCSTPGEAEAVAADLQMESTVIVPGTVVRRRGAVTPGTVLSVGRLVPGKRVDVLVRAVGRVEGARLTVAGSGPALAGLRALADDVAPGRVTFTGAVSDARLAELWATTAAYASASAFESFGIAAAEAVAAGIPAVVSDIPAHRSLPIPCVPADPEAFAVALTDALSGVLVSEGDGRDVMPEWDGYARSLDRLYADVLGAEEELSCKAS